MSYTSITPDEITGESKEIGFSGLFNYESTDYTPITVEAQEGIRLTAREMTLDESVLYMDILVSFTLDRSFVSQFALIEDAIVLIVERPYLKHLNWFTLADPHSDYIDYEGNNCELYRMKDLEGTSTQYCVISAKIHVNDAIADEQVFLRATLQEFTSNVAAIKLSDDGIEVSHYLEGEPYHPLSTSEFEQSMLTGTGDEGY